MDRKLFEITKGNEYTRQGLQMQKKLNLKGSKDLSYLSGMTYLNALLFDRYKKVLYKKVRNWVLSLVVILVALEALRYYLGPFELTDTILLRFLPFSFMNYAYRFVGQGGRSNGLCQLRYFHASLSFLSRG